MVKHMKAQEPTKFESRAREVFDASIDALDAQTRSRLNQARQQALAELEHRQRSPWVRWRPAAALGACALLALLVWRTPGLAPVDGAAASGDQLLEEFAFASQGEDLELAREDLGFYAFVASEAPSGGSGSG